jgi:hypothetical protein
MCYVTRLRNKKDKLTETRDTRLEKVVSQQARIVIVLDLLTRAFLAKKWKDAMV